MKKFLALIAALVMTLSLCAAAAPAFALYYEQHYQSEATFELLEEAHANAPIFMNEITGGTNYVGDPALDDYPTGTTYVYRSSNGWTNTSNAARMSTNLMVFTDEAFESKDAAFDYLTSLGLIDIIEEACGNVYLITPVDREVGFGIADQYAYYLLQSAMCNLGFSVREGYTLDPTYPDQMYFADAMFRTGKWAKVSVSYADAQYMGGLTYRYVIGLNSAASTFLNNYIASTFDDVSRIAGMLLIDGKMDRVRKVAATVPTYLVGASDEIIEKYKAANETNAWGRENGNVYYFNQAHPEQKVVVDPDAELSADLIRDVYYSFLIKHMRVPTIKSGLYTPSTPYCYYNWNQAPYSLSERNAIINGKTADRMVVLEFHDDRFQEYHTASGEFINTWFALLPEEMLDGTAADGSIPMLLLNHGGGDDPIQCIDELGWLTLAGDERIAIFMPVHTNATDTVSDMEPAYVRYILETYPQLDASRVYVTGYSMGGGATNRALYGDASLYAAAVPMSGTPYTHLEGQEEQFKDIDIPVMFTTCTYDTYTHFDSVGVKIAEDFMMNINDYLTYNEMEPVEFDFDKYIISGFEGDTYTFTMINDEYPNHTWFMLNDEGVPMVGLNVIEYIPHGLYQAYASISWNFMKHYSRNPETKEIIYTK